MDVAEARERLDTMQQALAAMHRARAEREQRGAAPPTHVFARNNKVILVLGPMFAGMHFFCCIPKNLHIGKSRWLEDYAKRQKHKQKSVVSAFKPERDTRQEADTHDGGSLWHTVQHVPSAVAIVASLQHSLSFLNADAHVVVMVDEGQFLPDLDELAWWVRTQARRITLLIAALSGTFQLKGFDGVSKTVPLATKIKLLSAVCMDCKDAKAHFSRLRPGQQERPAEGTAFLPGGEDKYAACCARCWRDPGPVPS